MPPSRKQSGRPAARGLTAAQQRTLTAIEDIVARDHRPPTMQELALERGITAASAHEQVNQLVRKGYLQRDPGKSRNLILIHPPQQEAPLAIPQLVEIPLVGVVTAGRPTLAEENIIGHVLVEESVAARGRCFALRVRGDSMRDARISDQDLVIVRQQPVAEHRDIVVALLEGEATVKRLAISEDLIQLLPENPQYHAITIAPDQDFRIIGKVVAVRRLQSPLN